MSRSPSKRSFTRCTTPKSSNSTQHQFQNNVSPLRAKFAGNVRVPERLGKTP